MTEEHLLKGWDEFEEGAILYSFEDTKARKFHINNSYYHHVSDWRAIKPVHNPEFCIDCQNCWVYCPDTAIIAKETTNKKGEKIGVFGHIDYDHCKGCGICVEVCPTNPKSLWMFTEQTPEEEALRNWPKKENKKD